MKDFTIRIIGNSAPEGGRKASELENYLTMNVPGVRTKRVKSESSSMDLGAIVSVLVGSAATAAIAEGIASWLAKRHDTEIEINVGGNIAKAKRINSADAVRIAELLAELQRDGTTRTT